jgi:hypothetical protein
MSQLLDQSTEQRFIQTGVSWKSFKAIQAGFADSPGVRLFYYEGELEILSTSPEHEIVKGNLLMKLETYLDDAMVEDKAFATEIRQLAQQIINIQNQNTTTLNQQNINYGRNQNIFNQTQGDIRIGDS